MRAILMILGVACLLIAIFAGGCAILAANDLAQHGDRYLTKEILLASAAACLVFGFLAWAFLGSWPGEDD